MPSLEIFAGLRLVQGIFMSAAFTLTMAHLAETEGAGGVASALAAYVTGNVASNLVGRLVSAAVADHFGLAQNFALFAALNLAGAVLAFLAFRERTASGRDLSAAEPMSSVGAILHRGDLLAAFGIGFAILFGFIGTFTYVNFVLVAPPIGLAQMQLGFVYFVFVPSILLTPLAGRAARRFGTRASIAAGLVLAVLAAPLLLARETAVILAGLALAAAGTFFAQAAATGYVSSAAGPHRAGASGLYLASYYAGGLAGSFVLGRVFDEAGWPATVGAIAIALAAGAFLSRFLVHARS
jgi:MFS transporter, YNFM family, putative membrane transport protein